MINTLQREVLESLIAEEGIYSTTIQDDVAFNLGIKILYLERAISQNCQEFLKSLDLIYDPMLIGEAKTANIEFIRALKLINDLCFNNEVKFGGFGTREALTHFFGALGNINPDDFKAEITTIINSRINALREGREIEVAAQKTIRETIEPNIIDKTEWREELDLPTAQLDHRMMIIQLAPQGFFQIYQLNELDNTGQNIIILEP